MTYRDLDVYTSYFNSLALKLLYIPPKKAAHPEYSRVEDDHDDAGYVEGSEGGVDDEVRVVEPAEVGLRLRHVESGGQGGIGGGVFRLVPFGLTASRGGAVVQPEHYRKA